MIRSLIGKVLFVMICLLIANFSSAQTDTTKSNKTLTEKYCKYDRNGNRKWHLKCDGEYRNGILWNGKHYVYDKNGLLIKIEIYKEGKYAGDGQIDY